MTVKGDLLSQTKPLADPLRAIALLAMAGAVVQLVISATSSKPLLSLGTACLLLGFAWLIAPQGRPNAIYLRAFRTDAATARLRMRISAVLGPRFRLSGIRPPRHRTSTLMRFFLPGVTAMRYAGSKVMELEAGDDWLARLWRTCQTARVVFIDLRGATSRVHDEIGMTLESVGPERCIFLFEDEAQGDSRRTIAEIAGPEHDVARFKLLEVSSEALRSRQFDRDLKRLMEDWPEAGSAGVEKGREFVLEHVDEAILRKSGSASFGNVLFALLGLGLGGLLNAMNHALPAFGAVVVLPLAVLVGIGIARLVWMGARRAAELNRAGHAGSAARASAQLVAQVLLMSAWFFLTIPSLLKLKVRANEMAAIIAVRTLNTAELIYQANYPERGFTCDLKALGGSPGAGNPSADAAQLVDDELAAGRKYSYVFHMTDCTTTKAAGKDVVTGYRIIADPARSSWPRARTFCSREDGVLMATPAGGGNCTEPVR